MANPIKAFTEGVTNQARALPKFMRQAIEGSPYEKNYLPKEGKKFVPGTEIQAPIGDELLRGTPYGPDGRVPMPRRIPTAQPSVTMSPTATPTPTVTPMPRREASPTTFPTNRPMPTPTIIPNTEQITGRFKDTVAKYFPEEEVNNALNVIFKESSGNPKNVHINSNGSEDRGLLQINSDTFKDFQRRHGEKLRRAGINSYDDMFDTEKNIQMARIIWDEQGWAGWYGARLLGLANTQ